MTKPDKAISINQLKPVDRQLSLTSSHEISRQSFEEQDETKIGYVKSCDANYPPELAEIEVGMSCLYRLVMGETAAEMRLVYNDQDQIVGTISIELPNYKPFGKIAPEKIPDAKALLYRNFILTLWASYYFEEDDLHAFNIGENGERVDFDMSAYPCAVEHKGARLIYWFHSIAAKFLITQGDINAFPHIQDACPCYWPTKNPENYNRTNKAFSRPMQEAFIELAKLKGTNNSKFQAMFGTLFLSKNIISQTLQPYLANQSIIELLAGHFSQRTFELTQALAVNQQFNDWLVTNASSFTAIRSELAQYQQRLNHIDQRFAANVLEDQCHTIVRNLIARHIEAFIRSLPQPEIDYSALDSSAKIYLQNLQPNIDHLNALIIQLANIKSKKIPGTNALGRLLSHLKKLVAPEQNLLAQSVLLEQSILIAPSYSELHITLYNKLLGMELGTLKQFIESAFSTYQNDTQFWRVGGRRRSREIPELLKQSLEPFDSFSYLMLFLKPEDNEWNSNDNYACKPSFNVVLMRKLLIPTEEVMALSAMQLKEIWDNTILNLGSQCFEIADSTQSAHSEETRASLIYGKNVE